MRSIASAFLAATILASASFTTGAFAVPVNGSVLTSPDTNYVQVTHKKKMMKKSKMHKPATSDTKSMDKSGGKM